MSELMDRGANAAKGGIKGALKGLALGLVIAALMGTGAGLLMGFAILPALGVTGAVASLSVAGGAAFALLSSVVVAPLTAKIWGGLGLLFGGLKNPVQNAPGLNMGQGNAPEQAYGLSQQPQQRGNGQFTGVVSTADMQQPRMAPDMQPAQGQGQGYYPPPSEEVMRWQQQQQQRRDAQSRDPALAGNR